MKKILLFAFSICIFTIINGCADSTSTSNNSDVNIVGELATQSANFITVVKNDKSIQTNECDSIKITRIRILMSGMKLFLNNEDTMGGKEMKAGPFVYDIDRTGKLVQLAGGSVQPGVYDKIKFEFHRFSNSDANQYRNHSDFMEFATSDRNSILIEGICFKDNIPSACILKCQTTANLLLKFEPSLNLDAGSNTTISIQVDPNSFLKKDGTIMDPNDPKNKNDIENAIIKTIKAVKK
jgi:hypothetical protein